MGKTQVREAIREYLDDHGMTTIVLAEAVEAVMADYHHETGRWKVAGDYLREWLGWNCHRFADKEEASK